MNMEKDINKNIINFDKKGNPIYKMSFRDIFKSLGAEINKNTGKLEISNYNSLLDICPVLLEKDQMGLGINEQYITQVDIDRVAQTCNVWRERKIRNCEIYAALNMYPGMIIESEGKQYEIYDIEYKDKENKVIVKCNDCLIMKDDVDNCSVDLFKKFEFGFKKN